MREYVEKRIWPVTFRDLFRDMVSRFFGQILETDRNAINDETVISRAQVAKPETG